MSDGNCTIRVKGVEYPLYFGRYAIEMIARRTEEDLSAENFKVTEDMFYGGIRNWQRQNQLPMSTGKDVFHITEDFFEEEDCVEQLTKVNECFLESKYGAEFKEVLNKQAELYKKKAMEIA